VLGGIGVVDWNTFAAFGDGPVLTDDRPQLEYYRTLPDEPDGWIPAAVPQSPVDAIFTE